MALYVRDWDGDVPRDGRVSVRVLRMTLERHGDRCDVQLYVMPARTGRPQNGTSTTMQVPTSVHDSHLFGGDVVLRADAQLHNDGVLEVSSLYFGGTPYAVSS